VGFNAKTSDVMAREYHEELQNLEYEGVMVALYVFSGCRKTPHLSILSTACPWN
jgi:hypothetical protein